MMRDELDEKAVIEFSIEMMLNFFEQDILI